MRPQAAWKVRIQMARAFGPTAASIRSRISPAALFVNVIARISFGSTPHAASRCATRYVSTRVLPEPAPATTSSGPSVVTTASRCAGFRSARYCSGDATAIQAMLAASRVHHSAMDLEALIASHTARIRQAVPEGETSVSGSTLLRPCAGRDVDLVVLVPDVADAADRLRSVYPPLYEEDW